MSLLANGSNIEATIVLQVTRWHMHPDKQWWQCATCVWSAARAALSGVLAERQDVAWARASPACGRGWTHIWLLLVPTHVFMESTVLLVSVTHILMLSLPHFASTFMPFPSDPFLLINLIFEVLYDSFCQIISILVAKDLLKLMYFWIWHWNSHFHKACSTSIFEDDSKNRITRKLKINIFGIGMVWQTHDVLLIWDVPQRGGKETPEQWLWCHLLSPSYCRMQKFFSITIQAYNWFLFWVRSVHFTVTQFISVNMTHQMLQCNIALLLYIWNILVLNLYGLLHCSHKNAEIVP